MALPIVDGRPLFVTPRSSPDLDGVACAIAYSELLCALGHTAVPLIDGVPDGEARFVLAELGCTAALPHAIDSHVILVDASDVLGLPAMVDPRKVIEVIDHRMHHDAARVFPAATLQIEPVGAAATLVAERWRAAGAYPSLASNHLLQAAIQSNTQALRGSVTTLRDVDASAWLSSLSPLRQGMVERQFAARTADIVADLALALRRECKTFDHQDGAFVVSQIELVGGLAALHDVEALTAGLGPRSMVNVVDTARASSDVVVIDPEFRRWVAARLGVEFRGCVAHSPRAMLRKQIVTKLLGHFA